jgi:hypothetical protein
MRRLALALLLATIVSSGAVPHKIVLPTEMITRENAAK